MMYDLATNSGLLPEIVLMVLLVATTFHAFRLERALGVLRRDRASLEKLVVGFSESIQQAEDGIERLRTAADDTGRQIARHIDQARNLKSDLEFLIARGERAADRLESKVTHAKTGSAAQVSAAPMALSPVPPLSLTSKAVSVDPDTRPRSQAERDLLRALRAAR